MKACFAHFSPFETSQKRSACPILIHDPDSHPAFFVGYLFTCQTTGDVVVLHTRETVFVTQWPKKWGWLPIENLQGEMDVDTW
jgi:hypothetical protein